jgi:hypothetical protein
MACRCISLSRPVRRMTIGCVQFSSGPYFHKRCCSRIVDTTRTGSESLPASKGHGRIFHPNEIAKTQSALVRICIERATWSSASSTRSSSVGVSRPDMTNSRPTIWRSLNSHQSEFGCALTSPRPSHLLSLVGCCPQLSPILARGLCTQNFRSWKDSPAVLYRVLLRARWLGSRQNRPADG